MTHYAEHRDLVSLLYEPTALYSVSWGRDAADNYTRQVQSMNAAPVPTEIEIEPLLPHGSNWQPAEGWRSIFGMPFVLNDQNFLAVGVESVYPHRRGAFPVLDAYIYPGDKPPLDGLLAIAKAVGEASDSLTPTHGIEMSSSLSPTEHCQTESRLIRHALSSYQRNERLLFITLLLSEDTLRMPGFPSLLAKLKTHSFKLVYEQYLLATVPSIYSTFSFGAKLSLKKSQRLF